MGKKLILNAFDMNCAAQVGHGLWRHPEEGRHRYKELSYWVEMAELLEKGLFDALFLADSSGTADVYKNSSDPEIREAVLFPSNDPFCLVPAMAQATRHLSFVVTASTTYEPPFSFARKITTLDHLTAGRIGWNIVTSVVASQARNHGLQGLIPHDERYEIADEFAEVEYKLWEGSWEEDANVRHLNEGIYFDPAKIHKINHRGKYFSVEGPHTSEPSPQRTPVLFQAGSSGRGVEFAAKHAEAVIVVGNDAAEVKRNIDKVRTAAARYGRRPDSVKFFSVIIAIAGETEREARERYEEYGRYWSREAALAYICGLSGYDLAALDPKEYVEFKGTERHQTAAGFVKDSVEKRRTAGELMQEISGIGAQQKVLVGDPRQIADEMQAWAEQTGIDGFNLLQFVAPIDIRRFVELVVPELQRRGLYKTEYAEGTFRERLFGAGRSRLPADHPAHRFRK